MWSYYVQTVSCILMRVFWWELRSSLNQLTTEHSQRFNHSGSTRFNFISFDNICCECWGYFVWQDLIAFLLLYTLHPPYMTQSACFYWIYELRSSTICMIWTSAKQLVDSIVFPNLLQIIVKPFVGFIYSVLNFSKTL